MSEREWQGRAACRDVDPERFFPMAEAGPELARQVARAKRVCTGCPVLAQCREFALAELAHGIAGGMTEAERAAFRARRPSSRLASVVGSAVPAMASNREVAAAGRAAIRAGRGHGEVAREFGVSARTVKRWVAQVRDEAKRGVA
jgi:hypothetical protein